ncbi:MAG: hypothetical protein WDM77_12430 [Steroidobacteraceae bacterium]
MLAIRDTGRRKRLGGAIGIRKRHGEQVDLAPSAPFIVGDCGAHGSRATVFAMKTANQHDRRGRTLACGDRDGINSSAAGRQADVEDLG